MEIIYSVHDSVSVMRDFLCSSLCWFISLLSFGHYLRQARLVVLSVESIMALRLANGRIYRAATT